MFTHIVFFKLADRDNGSGEKIQDMLSALGGKIPEIRSIEVGLDVIHSGRSYDVALVTRFDSREDMEAYQVHPEHLKVVEFIRGATTGSAAVDYQS